MKIIQLTASNVKRLKAVEITPDGTLQVIGGRNAQGKTSVLDAIWLALGGGVAAKGTTLPIRDGETTASVTLDLGDLIVVRSWTQKGTTLKVASKDGALYSSPQKMLDDLVGRLSFDPLAFTRLSAREQRDALLDLVDLDVDMDAIDSERSRLYEERTEVGRQGKALGDAAVDESLPTDETSASEIIAKIREAEDHNREIGNALAAVEVLANKVTYRNREIESLEEQLADAREHLTIDESNHKAAQEKASALLPKRSTDALEASLATVEETNAAIRANNDARARADRKTHLRNRYNSLTEQIDSLDSRKVTAIKAAKFPVVGLGFDENGVTYQGVPFTQASSAEQIKVSLAMAMALNPQLRVLRIKDGSLLDVDTLAAIREQVAEHDFQLWIERVGDADEGAVIIQDGEVA